MLESLPTHIRDVLLSYDFIKNYLEGKISKRDFLKTLKSFEGELVSNGVEHKYLQAIADTDDESEFNRKASHSRFVRFARRLGLDIATGEDKIRFIKSINAEKFLDILSISAGLLSGAFIFQKIKDRKEEKIIVSAMLFGTDIEPPEKSQLEFKKFFVLMRKEITVSNMDVWAVKLFFAIIFAHMFPNGNGRLARNAYFILRSSGLIDEQKSSTRTKAIMEAGRRLNLQAIGQLMLKDGIKFKYVDDFAASEELEEDYPYFPAGHINQLKYIAARRILIRRGEWDRWKEKEVIGMKNWPKNLKDESEVEYKKVRIEWFWECMRAAEEYHNFFASKLDELLAK